MQQWDETEDRDKPEKDYGDESMAQPEYCLITLKEFGGLLSFAPPRLRSFAQQIYDDVSTRPLKQQQIQLDELESLIEKKWFGADVRDPDGLCCVVATDDIENWISEQRQQIIQPHPTYTDLVAFARSTQEYWIRAQEIMRNHGIVIDDDSPMQKFAFTLYTDLCEIDQKVSCLFEEGHGDKNYDLGERRIADVRKKYTIAAQQPSAIAELERLKEDLRSRIISQSNQWSKGRNSGLLECCNIIDDYVARLKERTP